MDDRAALKAVSMLRGFADREGLGKPTRALFMDEMFVSGIGCEWPGEIRNAVTFSGNDRSENAKAAHRMVRNWMEA